MRHLHKIFAILIIGVIFYACSSSPSKSLKTKKEKPVVIANDSLEYEIIIIDVGFNAYLNSIAKPMGFYTQSFLENRNNIYVINWNLRAQNPLKYDGSIYENVIQYNSRINYGMEVNYKLFNYFQFAQQKYKMSLDGTLPRVR